MPFDLTIYGTTIPLLPFVVVIAVTGLVYSVTALMTGRDSRIDSRLEELEAMNGSTTVERAGWKRRLLAPLQELMPQSLVRVATETTEGGSRVQKRLMQAGYYGHDYVPLFAAARCGLALLPVAVAVVCYAKGWGTTSTIVMWTAVGSGIGVVLPGLWLDRAVRRRQARFMKAIPDLFDLLVTCLSSGLTIEASIKRVAEELRLAHPDLANELSRVQNEIHLGISVVDALKHFAERCNLNPIRSLAMMCEQTRQYGTRAIEALRVHANMMRTQREQRAEERARKAAVKILAPTVLLIFPSVFVVVAGPAAIQIAETMPSAPEKQAEQPEGVVRR